MNAAHGRPEAEIAFQPPDSDGRGGPVVVRRNLTAMGRGDLSVPVRQVLADRQIEDGRSILDYGCGRGHDVRELQRLGHQADGWDPHYRPGGPTRPADVVLLTYVLNVIEDPAERRLTLGRAWGLATSLLVVSARLTWEKGKVSGQRFGDGVLTGRRTFQYLFGATELRAYVEEVTGARAVSAAPGIVYAFKNERARLAFLARRIVPDAVWTDAEDTTSALAAVIDHVERRGRPPRPEETPQRTADLLAHVSPTELKRLVRASADPGVVDRAAKRSTLNTLLYLAVELFNGRGPFSSLPLSVQFDIRAFFPSYREACRRSDRLLLKLRDDHYVRRAMDASPVGKLTPTALYAHRRAIDRMPTVLRLYEHCASIAAGRPAEWAVLKLQHRGRAVSWLDCPDFDRDPHPRIRSSYMVDLQSLKASHVAYSEGADQPLLHRKHEFLAVDDPHAPRYRRLTESERRAGLYDRPHLIGTKSGWEAELTRCGRRLRGHRLVRRPAG